MRPAWGKVKPLTCWDRTVEFSLPNVNKGSAKYGHDSNRVRFT